MNKNDTSRRNNQLISIIVPVYNAAPFLDDTVNTVLDQTHSNWELILINDHSSDNSKEVVDKYLSDHRIQWFDLPKKSTAAIARNKGIKMARGNYICFLDADDLWRKDKLEKQLKFMREKNCAFSFTGYEFADENGKPNGKKVFVPEKINHKQAMKNTIISTITIMLDMTKLSKDDILMPNIPSEDTATWWKILKKIDYAYGMPEIYAYYRRSKGTLSSNKIEAIKRIWNLYRKYEKLNILQSSYNLFLYSTNAVRRRI